MQESLPAGVQESLPARIRKKLSILSLVKADSAVAGVGHKIGGSIELVHHDVGIPN